MKNALSIVAAAVLVITAVESPAGAKVRLPEIFSDNMVLQHSTDVKLWGSAAPGATVKVKASWVHGSIRTRADGDGRWSVTLHTPKPGGPHSISISDGEALTLDNVLCGEVWLCGGQSNMQMPVGSSWGKVLGWEQELAGASGYDRIRLLKVNTSLSTEPLEEADIQWGGWTPVNAETLDDFSATAWFYGKKLYEELGIPVGLIQSCWGGSVIEAWMSRGTVSTIKEYDTVLRGLAEIPSDKREHSAYYGAKLAEWLEEMSRVDYAYQDGVAVWAMPGTDLSGWEECTVPGYLQWQGLEGYHGYFWMRRDVEIPSEWAGEDLDLWLGFIDDDDCAFVNGEFVGHTEQCTVQRKYKIPARVLHEGVNTIAVRVRDTGGYSGMMGGDDNIYLAGAQGQRLPLTGRWYCRETVSPDKTPVYPVNPDNLYNTPITMYNAMIWPLRDVRIRGAIWYQGESNASAAEPYKVLMPTMIRDWRQTWGYDFPFYFAQLANYGDVQKGPENSEWAELREAQTQSLCVQGTGMAVLIDIGEADDIHPKNKPEVGRRLALNALALTYGKDVAYSGPIYDGYSIEGSSIRIRFKHAEGGLGSADGKALGGFYMAGQDRLFHPAKAVIDGQTVIVSCPEVTNAIAVRYAWANNPPCNLVGATGLPASPFRTDSWSR